MSATARARRLHSTCHPNVPNRVIPPMDEGHFAPREAKRDLATPTYAARPDVNIILLKR